MKKLLLQCPKGLWLLLAFSLVAAVLQFVLPLYMMAVYNRVLQTQSIETLRLISIIAVILLLVMGLAEIARTRLLSMMAMRLTDFLNRDVYLAVLAAPGSSLDKTIGAGTDSPRTQAYSDLRTLTQFVASGALNTMLDAVLAPMFLIALFVLHPLIGGIGLVAACVIFGLAIASEIVSRQSVPLISRVEGRAQNTIEKSLNQFDAVTSMGMAAPLYKRWERDRTAAAGLALQSQTAVGLLQGFAKAARMMVQLGVLGVGAWLVITSSHFLAGAIIASSIIMGRALAPIDQSIAQWRMFVTARESANRLVKIMEAVDQEPARVDLPAPHPALLLRSLTIGFPGQPMSLLQNVNLVLGAGQSLGIFGPNGVGKTTLLRAIVGLLQPSTGEILLGATTTDRFSDTDRQRHFGYLPQNVQLLPGTVGENICRFSKPDDDNKALFAAVQATGTLETIQHLSASFATELTEHALSSGQTQMIGLARAIYGDPLLLVLDEPTANLDPQGQDLVMRLLQDRAARGRITVFTSHDEKLLQRASHMMMIVPGKVSIGTTPDMIRMLTQRSPS